MKVNYFAYCIKDNSTGFTAFENISDIINLYCLHKNKLELSKDRSLKKLYLAKPEIYNDVYYFMTPAVLAGYKAVDRLSGIVNDLVSILGTDSLEKVSYVYIDPTLPILGLASGRGCADIEDLIFFVESILNEKNKKQRYKIQTNALKSEISKSSASDFKLITEAKIKLNNARAVDVLSGFIGKSPSENMEVEIKIKRTNKKENIKDFINPLIKKINNDIDKEYAEIYFRGKATELQSNIKDYLLDSSGNIFDVINPNIKMSMEEQIIEKRYRNQEVVDAFDNHFNSFNGRILENFDSRDWINMLEKE